jgi:hypothetical protein
MKAKAWSRLRRFRETVTPDEMVRLKGATTCQRKQDDAIRQAGLKPVGVMPDAIDPEADDRLWCFERAAYREVDPIAFKRRCPGGFLEAIAALP